METRSAPTAQSVVRRMVGALVLIPIVPSVALVVSEACREFLLPTGADSYRWFDLCFSSMMVLGTILVWRTLVAWTLGRKVRTALISMIPFVQVVYAQPLWNAGCVFDDFLKIGQEQLGIAVWTWLLVWAWWGWEQVGEASHPTPPLNWRTRMNPRIRMVVASIGTLPFVVATSFILAAVFDDLLGVQDERTLDELWAATTSEYA